MCLASNLNEDPQLSTCMVFPLKANHFEIDLKTWLNQGRWSTQGDLCISSSCWGSQWKLEWKQCSLNVPQFKSDYSDLSFFLRRPTETLLLVPSQIIASKPIELTMIVVTWCPCTSKLQPRLQKSGELACGAGKDELHWLFTDCLQLTQLVKFAWCKVTFYWIIHI